MVVFAFALADGGAVLMARAGQSMTLPIVAAMAAGAMAVPYVRSQLDDRQTRRAIQERWEWQGRDLALVLRSAFARQRPLVAVTAAGCIPYWSELPSLDMLGLNDFYIPRHRPANMGQGPLGHELGDGQYVLDRNADLIVFNVGTEPAYRPGEQLSALPEFHRRYVPAQIAAGGEDYRVYVNRYSQRVGVAQSASAITVPAYLFEGAAVHLNAANRLVVPVSASAPVRATIEVDPGRQWDVEVESRDAGRVAVEVSRAGGTLTIALRAKDGDPIEVQSVTLRAL
jgi:hypothetical protein